MPAETDADTATMNADGPEARTGHARPGSRPADRSRHREGRVAAAWIVGIAVQAGLSLGSTGVALPSPSALFALVVLATTLCVAGAGALLVLAHHHDRGELGILGMVFMVISALPLVHGLTTPGALYGPNAAAGTSIVIAPFLALTCALPWLLAGRPVGQRVIERWRTWVAVWTVLLTNVCTLLLAAPDLIPAPAMRGSVALAAGVLGACVFLVLSLRHVRLARQGGGEAMVRVAIGFALIGAAQLVWFAKEPFTAGFWLAHLLDAGGVFVGLVALISKLVKGEQIMAAVEPVTAVRPLEAFRANHDDHVRALVDAIARKHPGAAEHSRRVAEVSLLIAEQAELPPDEVGDAALAGLLHDVGLIWVSSHLVSSGNHLSDDYRLHAERAARVLNGSRATAHLMPVVAAHHERLDGSGYPNRLVGDAIPRVARVIAIADRLDELVFRDGLHASMTATEALFEIERESGRAYDAELVAALRTIIVTAPAVGGAAGDVLRARVLADA
jgi:HD-GYP domain-containing protein (c-di-GMP phosphodiesterase class II)